MVNQINKNKQKNQTMKTYFEREIKKHNLTIVEEDQSCIQCNDCKQIWWLRLRTGGKLPYRWWHRPNECNTGVKNSTQQ